MSLGILNNVSAIYAENNLNSTQSSLQTVLQQLSSGARINSGADDAAGLAIANGLKANENALTQSQQNAADGIGLLSTADGALSQVTNLLDRAVTLATEVGNSTLSGSQVSSANQEYQSIIAEIGNIGSTTNFNGNNVFSSTATTFYVGDGTSSGSNNYNDVTGALSVTSVGQSAPLSGATAVAAALLGTAPTSNSTPLYTTGSVTTSTLTFNAAGDTAGGTFSFTDSRGTASITVTAGSTLASAATQIGTQLNAQIGSGTNYAVTNPGGALSTILITDLGAGSAATPGAATGLTDTTPVHGTATFTLTNATDTIGGSISFTQGTETATTSIAAGSTLAQAVAALNATGGVFANAGIVASIGGTKTLVLTNSNSLTSTAGAAAQSLVATTAGSALTDTQTTLSLAVPTPSASAAGQSSKATFAALQAATDTIVGTLKVSVGAGAPISVALTAGTTLSAAVALLNNNAQLKAAGITASTVSGQPQLVLTGPLGTGTNSSDLGLTGTVLSDAPASSGAGAGTDFTASTISSLSTASAQNVLTGVNAAIQNISYQRGVLGAYSNQLTAASNTAASENVNLTSAESSIRSTNYGQATSDLAKYEVLSQTGISALAQANSVQQEILKLLQ